MSRQRRSYQREVERLLGRIGAQQQELRRLEAAGVRRSALADLEHEAERSRRRLAAVIAGHAPASSGARRHPDAGSQPGLDATAA